MDCLKEIEQQHMELHDKYMEIFKIYFGEEDRSFLSRFFGSRKKISPENQQLAKEHYKELKSISEKLIGSIERLERRLFALRESNFV